MSDTEIGYDEARKMALLDAATRLKRFNLNNLPVLREDYIEGKHFWMFFKNKEIVGQDYNQLSWKGAYMVIKKNGKQFGPPDYSDEPEKLKEYLEFLDESIPKRWW